MSPTHQHLGRHSPLFTSSTIRMAFFLLFLLFLIPPASSFFFPHNGTATITHYSAITSSGLACDCKSTITRYPIAAVNQNAFGATSSSGAGPACGMCYLIKLWGSVEKNPGYNITGNQTFPEIVVKVADQCPNRNPNLDWCSQTDSTPNKYGAWVHFDLGEQGLPARFFPEPFGYDFGTWWANYTEVSCRMWAGYNDTRNVGADSVGCCPLDPMVSGNYCNFTDGRQYNGSEYVPQEQISGGPSIFMGISTSVTLTIITVFFMWIILHC